VRGDCQQETEHPNQTLHQQMNVLMSRLDEQQRRCWYVALESNRIGHGGDVLLMAKITGMDEKTIRRGRRELEAGLADRPARRIRLAGGGRPLRSKKRPGHRRGDPGIGRGANRRRSDEREEVGAGQPSAVEPGAFSEVGHAASAPTVGRLLRKLGFGLRANVKSMEMGSNHPDRDTQFGYITERKAKFVTAGEPVISVETKKKDLIGNFKNAGQAWRTEAEQVTTCMTSPVTLTDERSPMVSMRWQRTEDGSWSGSQPTHPSSPSMPSRRGGRRKDARAILARSNC
jgi:hypothetical protein